MPRRRQQPNFTQLTPFERGRILGQRERGASYRAIAAAVGRSVATVLAAWRAWSEGGLTQRARGTGPSRRTTPRQDRLLQLMALRDRQRSTRSVADAWLATVGRPIQLRTVYHRLRLMGLTSYRPRLVLPLAPQHRRQRLDWSNERRNWGDEWHHIAFSDESRFCLGGHDGRGRVRRRRGERRHLAFAVERHVHRTIGLMVWGAIAFGSKSPLIVIRGTMTAVRYVDVVLRPVVLPYVRGIEEGVFQQDNARPHIARTSMRFLEEERIPTLPWPPRSPDLSPIEKVWDWMGIHIQNLPQPPSTLDELRHAVEDAWDAVPLEYINNQIDSIPRRLQECIRLRGGPTYY